MSQIRKSVGKGGDNDENDVETVQELLNKFTSLGGYSKLKVDGNCGPKTLAAIGAFQQKVMKMNRPDQRVDPGRDTFKKLNENPSSVAKAMKEDEKEDKDASAAASKGNGKVTGDTNGVKKPIIDFLNVLADHYGTVINVTSGLRDKNDQARIMWKYWTKTLDRGKVYVWLRETSDGQKVRQQLDDWWTEGHKPGGDTSGEKKFKEKIVSIADVLSAHLRGEAVDISTNVDKRVITVLNMYLHPVKEKDPEGKVSGLHWDIARGKKMPPSPVTDAIKAKWPKP
jgi:hypothetical protein